MDRKYEIMNRLYSYMQDESQQDGKDDLEYLNSKFDETEDIQEREKILLAIDKELIFQGR